MTTAATKQMDLRSLSRAERARIMAGRLSEAVRRAVPPGIGHWPPAWEVVEAPSAAFLDALRAWEAAGDGAPNERELREAIDHAARRALAAWREAARRWEAAGRPAPAREVAHVA
jgi:hypothetical protein